jgi:hypothetical protein
MERFVLAQFDTPAPMLEAARTLRREGHGVLEAYTPYPLHGLEEALGLRKSIVPRLAALGGLMGVGLAYGGQWYLNGINYPLVVGAKPPHSPPMFVPITFELGVLLTAFFIFFGLMFLWGLPRPHHPVFEVEAFRSASTHAFWLSVPVTAPHSVEAVTERLKALGASELSSGVDEP